MPVTRTKSEKNAHRVTISIPDKAEAEDLLLAAADGTAYRSAIAYSSAKRVVAQGVRERARTWGDAGVRLNAVAPGRMETPMLDGLLADPLIAAGIDTLPIGVRARSRATAADTERNVSSVATSCARRPSR